MLTGLNVFCYAVVNRSDNSVLEYRFTAREALQSARDYRIYSTIYKNVDVYRVPFLSYGKGEESVFVNLGDEGAGYVPKDFHAPDSLCKYVSDKLFILEASLMSNSAPIFYNNIMSARAARDILYKKTERHSNIYYADVFDVNPKNFDSRYFRRVRNLDGLDYIISPVYNKVF